MGTLISVENVDDFNLTCNNSAKTDILSCDNFRKVKKINANQQRYLISRKVRCWGIMIMVGLYFLAGTSTRAEESTAAITPYPPFVILEEKQTFSGVVVDVLDLFQEKYPAHKIVYKNYPVKRTRRMEKRGDKELDITMSSPLFASQEMLKHFEYTAAIVRTKDKVITRKKSSFIYKKPQDLYGKTVGIISGYSYGMFDELFKGGKIRTQAVKTHIQNIKKLNKGRIDAYFGNIHVSPLLYEAIGISSKRIYLF